MASSLRHGEAARYVTRAAVLVRVPQQLEVP
eukprot:CAMPEP_0179858718 /NCGR_PEP_ID=MMETSP0982-20121206/12599_1 /TAXON_ID=483367 /ORGANISM="non described non described, Strain CCMP 2436" /LENGTH=30 /DNA_ID= /DNA_START= /DNA_END= /DNA_ORIENTATION=